MTMSTFVWLQNRVVFGRRTKRMARLLLAAPAIVDSASYRWLYTRRMVGEMDRLSQKPLFIRMETTNRCRAACSFCPHQAMKRTEGEMAMGLYERIVSQIRRMDIGRLNLHGFGEPFLDPHILERIEIARKAGIRHIATNTNGAALNDKLIDGCLDTGLDEIYISLDAATEDVYRTMRPGLSFHRVERNIGKLVEAKRKRGDSRLKIFLSFVECRQNRHEVRPFLKKWSSQADGISISYLHNWGDRLNFNPRGRAVRRDPCRHLWAGLDVNIEGRVPLCCYDYETSIPLGDLKTQDLEEVWRGEPLARYRKHHLRRDYANIALCRGCNANYHDKNPWWLSQ